MEPHHWTVGHSTVQPLDSLTLHYLTFRSWTQDCPTIGLLEKAQSYHWTVDTQLTSHRTVEHSTKQPLDCWTQHCRNIGHFDKMLSENCPTIGMLDTALFKRLHN